MRIATGGWIRSYYGVTNLSSPKAGPKIARQGVAHQTSCLYDRGGTGKEIRPFEVGGGTSSLRSRQKGMKRV